MPYFDDDIGERAARDGNGNVYYVPSDMKYEEWKEKYIVENIGDSRGNEAKSDNKYNYNTPTENKIAENGLQSASGRGIIDVGGGDMVEAIQSPIEQRNTAKGNPNAILQFGVGLNGRQTKILNSLGSYDSRLTVKRNSVNMKDLAALTAQTGVEFAMFTKGSQRLIVRGDARHVNISPEVAEQMANDGWRWSGHTHPGHTELSLLASEGDKLILKQFNQERSVVYNSKGMRLTFDKE